MIQSVRKRFPAERRHRADSGLSLVELIIATVLSLTLIGVIVSAIITSLNIASATSDNIKTSVDVRLVSAYLARDAQGAAGTDPNTIQRPSETGVSVANGDWNGCSQSGTLVARFSWIDRVTVSEQRKVTVTWALNGSELRRLYCEDGTQASELILGRTLTSATARCLPVADCSGNPESISLTVAGRAEDNTYSTTVSASLRPRGQDFPTSTTASTVRLLALGDRTKAAPCTTVLLNSTQVYVVGDAVIGDECGAGAISPGTANLTHPGVGVTSLAGNLSDPLAAAPVLTSNCSGSNPSPIGESIADPTVYPNAVVIGDGDIIDFKPGRYVFCDGLTIRAGATVTSSGGVFFYIKNGTLNIDPAAAVTLTGMTSGEHRNLLIWVATKQTVSIGTGAHVTRLGGTIYAPTSNVVFNGSTSAAAVNVGALVAQTVSVSSAGGAQPAGTTPTSSVPVIRFGPVPTLGITPDVLPNAKAGESYTQQLALTGDVGELQSPRWSATGLDPFVINATTGAITGTAPCSATLTPSVRVVDSTGLAVSATYTLIVDSDIVMADPGPYARGTVELSANLAESCNTPGTTVTIEYSLQGNLDDNGDPIWSPMCTDSVAPFTCSWVTTDTAKYTNGATYDLRATATLGATGTTSISEPVEGIIIDNGFPSVTLASPGATPLRGTVTLVADAIDNETGIARVRFEVSPKNQNAWMEVCNKTQPFDPANQSIYRCDWDTTAFVPAELGTVSYDIRALAADRAGNGDVSYQNDKTINNNSASISIQNPGAYVRGTVSLAVNTYVPSPATVTSVRIQVRPQGGTWADLCTDNTDPWGCSWNTTGLTDNATYELRAFMTDSRNVPAAESATISTIVDNALVFGVDVQAGNGSKLSYDKGKGLWLLKSLRLGRLDQNKTDTNNKPQTYDRIVLTYSKAINPATIISGWNGANRTVWIRLRDKGIAGNYSTTNDTLDVCTTWTSGNSCASVANLGWVKFALDTVAGGKVAIFESFISHQVVGGRSVITVSAVLKKFNDSRGTNVAVMVWTPSAAAQDTLGNASSTRPAAESGTNDKDF